MKIKKRFGELPGESIFYASGPNPCGEIPETIHRYIKIDGYTNSVNLSMAKGAYFGENNEVEIEIKLRSCMFKNVKDVAKFWYGNRQYYKLPIECSTLPSESVPASTFNAVNVVQKILVRFFPETYVEVDDES